MCHMFAKISTGRFSLCSSIRVCSNSKYKFPQDFQTATASIDKSLFDDRSLRIVTLVHVYNDNDVFIFNNFQTANVDVSNI
jgi:hypothetical protein